MEAIGEIVGRILDRALASAGRVVTGAALARRLCNDMEKDPRCVAAHRGKLARPQPDTGRKQADMPRRSAAVCQGELNRNVTADADPHCHPSTDAEAAD